MAILLQVLGWSLLASAGAMTSDPAYYSQQTPFHARPAPYLQSQQQQQLRYPVRAAAQFSFPPRSSAVSAAPSGYDTDYTGRRLRYRPADMLGYRPAAERRVASYTASDAPRYVGTNGYYQPTRDEGYRKVSYDAPSYASDDGGRIAGKYMVLGGGSRGFGGVRNSRPYQEEQSQGYLGDDTSII